MKAKDIEPCKLCSKPLMHTGVPLCWEISITRISFDLDAIRRESGFQMMMDSARLAEAMGRNEDLSKPIGDAVKCYVCENCMIEPHILAELVMNE